MRKLVSACFFSFVLLLSLRLFAGQGYYVTIHNNLSEPILYNEILLSSWYRNDIPKNPTLLNSESSTHPMYTEYDANVFTRDDGSIVIQLEKASRGIIGTFEISEMANTGTYSEAPYEVQYRHSIDYFFAKHYYSVVVHQNPREPIINTITKAPLQSPLPYEVGSDQYFIDVYVNPQTN